MRNVVNRVIFSTLTFCNEVIYALNMVAFVTYLFGIDADATKGSLIFRKFPCREWIFRIMPKNEKIKI